MTVQFRCHASRLTHHKALPLRELEARARPLLTVLLALFSSRVARDEARFLQPGSKLGIQLHQRARDPVTHRERRLAGAIVGRALYDGHFTVTDALAAVRGDH